MTLNGFDIYSDTPEADVVTALASDFVIVKASEGVTYVNPKHDEHVQRARTASKLVGHYHYARPDANGPDTEARAFLRAIKPLPGEVVVLDFEPPQILPVHPTWVLGFADVVTTVTGAPCWLYTNQSQGRALMALATPQQRVQLALMPLWKAYYQTSVGDLMGWPSWACWQRTSTPMDADVFNGDAAAWRALGVPEADVALTADDKAWIKAALTDAQKPSATDLAETRRMLGVLLGWRTPTPGTPEDVGLAALRATTAIDLDAIATAVNDEAHRRSAD